MLFRQTANLQLFAAMKAGNVSLLLWLKNFFGVSAEFGGERNRLRAIFSCKTLKFPHLHWKQLLNEKRQFYSKSDVQEMISKNIRKENINDT